MESLKTRTYFGEYTLKHWVDLLIKGDLILPDYQRSFVWSKEKVKKLIEGIRDGQFIPPVIIGSYNDPESKNMIIDGQQRLTSLLLYCLNAYPFKAEELSSKAFSEEDDENEDSNENPKQILWTVRELVNLKKNLAALKDFVTNNDDYEQIYEDCTDVDDVLENHYIGFSYIVPDENDEVKQSKYYSTVFRNINYLGQNLSAQDSRRSLYFLDKKYKDFFDTKALEECTIDQNSVKRSVDAVRYFSMLSQFKKDRKTDGIAYGYGSLSKRENYYEKYINAVVANKDNSTFEKFENIFPGGIYAPRLEALKNKISLLNVNKNFTSIIDADYFLFGLIYFIIFENKDINLDKTLIDSIQDKIRIKKENGGKSGAKYRHSPNALTNVRDRMKSSINLYKKYVS